MSAWTEHVERWRDCQRCPLAKQRGRICIARGRLPADVLFIGEAPGPSEDVIGFPFVGPAGKLLDSNEERRRGIIQEALPHYLAWSKPDRANLWMSEIPYALTNLVLCFPRAAKARGDNEPERAEIAACRPRLVEFVNIVQPRLIVCVGSLVTQHVDHNDSVPCCDMVHPAAMLRMKLAQRQQAIQRAIVILRTAVRTHVVEAPRAPFKEWGINAAVTESQGLRQRYDAWAHGEDDVPF